jgi:hypothetical protein
MPPNRHTEGLFEQADATASTSANNGEIRINLGDSTKGTGIDAGVPFWGTDGFLSRPADPDANGAAQIFFVNDGNLRRCIGSRDRRFLAQAGTIDSGDRVMYSPSGARVRIDDSEGTVEMRTSGGATMVLSDDEFTITLANGATFTLNGSEFDVSVPTLIPSGITIDATEAVITAKNIGQTINLDANSFVTLGLTAGLTRPFIVSVENVNIGPGGGITVPSPKVFAASA